MTEDKDPQGTGRTPDEATKEPNRGENADGEAPADRGEGKIAPRTPDKAEGERQS